MARSHAEMPLISALQNLNFLMTKTVLKIYALDCCCKCPCTFLHSNAQKHSLVFNKKPLYVKLTTFPLARNIEN